MATLQQNVRNTSLLKMIDSSLSQIIEGYERRRHNQSEREGARKADAKQCEQEVLKQAHCEQKSYCKKKLKIEALNSKRHLAVK